MRMRMPQPQQSTFVPTLYPGMYGTGVVRVCKRACARGRVTDAARASMSYVHGLDVCIMGIRGMIVRIDGYSRTTHRW